MMTHAPSSRRRPIDAARPGGACPPEREAGLSALSAQTLRSKSIIWVGSLEPENKELRKEYDLKEKYVSSGLQMVMFYARRGHTVYIAGFDFETGDHQVPPPPLIITSYRFISRHIMSCYVMSCHVRCDGASEDERADAPSESPTSAS